LKRAFLLILVACSFLLRIWHGNEFFFWNVDEEIIALTVKRIIIDHIPQLIGFPIPGGIYLGPLVYYLISLFFVLAFMDPMKLPIFAAIVGTLSVFLVYKVGKTIFEDEKIGIIASFLYAFSYLVNIYTRIFNGLIFVPLIALTAYWLLFKIIKTKSQKYILILGLLLSVFAQDEAASLSLIVLTILCFFVFKIRIALKNLVNIVGVFVLAHLSLLIFDLRHNHYLIKSFVNSLSQPDQKTATLLQFESIYKAILIIPSTMTRFLVINGPLNIADQILPCADLLATRVYTLNYAVMIIAVFALFYFIFKTVKNKSATGNRIIFLYLLLIILGIAAFNIFLGGYLFEWMLVVFFPAFAFIYAYLLVHIWKYDFWGRIVVLLFLFGFAVLNVRSIFLTNADFGLANKVQAVKYAIDKVGGQPFELDSIGSCYAQGYIYLFWQGGQLPVKSYADDMFSSTLRLNPNNIKPKMRVVIVNPSATETYDFKTKYQKYLKTADYRARFGKIEVLVGD